MGIHPLRKPWVSPGSALWLTKRCSVLDAHSIKQSIGVIGVMRCNGRIRMQKSKSEGFALWLTKRASIL